MKLYVGKHTRSAQKSARNVPTASRMPEKGPQGQGSHRRVTGRKTMPVVAGLQIIVRAAPLLAAFVLLVEVTVSASRGVLVFLVSNAVTGAGVSVGLESLVPVLTVIAVVSALATVGLLLQNGLRLLATGKLQRYVADQVIDVVASVDPSEFERADFQDRLDRARAATSRPAEVAISILGLVGGVSAFVSMGSVLAAQSPSLMALLTVTSIPAAWVNSRFSKDFKEFYDRQVDNDRRSNYVNSLIMSNNSAVELRAYGLIGELRRRSTVLYEERRGELRRLVRRYLVPFVVHGSLSTAILMSGLVWLAVMVMRGQLPVASATVLGVVAVQFTSSLLSITASVSRLRESAVFIEDISSFESVLKASRRRGANGSRRPAPKTFETISVRDVVYLYPGAAEPTLNGVSLTLNYGEIVALVGGNGSGKSTFAKLLSHQNRPTRGTIYWDDVDTALVDAVDLQESVTVLFQTYNRYLFSAADNIGFGYLDELGDRRAIEQAGRKAQAESFVARLDETYDAQLGTIFGGAELSGGQWQKLAVARAIFRSTPLVVLDEPTSSLDPRSEAAFLRDLRALFSGQTILVVSHRLAAIKNADRIAVMEAGKIVESGKHEQLMALNGLYAKMYHAQKEGTAPPHLRLLG